MNINKAALKQLCFIMTLLEMNHPESESSILWGDPAIGIDSPLHLMKGPPLLATKELIVTCRWR